jgi:hypothetical protein
MQSLRKGPLRSNSDLRHRSIPKDAQPLRRFLCRSLRGRLPNPLSHLCGRHHEQRNSKRRSRFRTVRLSVPFASSETLIHDPSTAEASLPRPSANGWRRKAASIRAPGNPRRGHSRRYPPEPCRSELRSRPGKSIPRQGLRPCSCVVGEVSLAYHHRRNRRPGNCRMRPGIRTPTFTGLPEVSASCATGRNMTWGNK